MAIRDHASQKRQGITSFICPLRGRTRPRTKKLFAAAISEALVIYRGCLIVCLTPFLLFLFLFFKGGEIVWGELEVPNGMNWTTKPLGYNSLTDKHP